MFDRELCVPAISDACTIDLVEEGGHRYRIRQPAENPSGKPAGNSLSALLSWWTPIRMMTSSTACSLN
jgi:hypothetical protein